MSLSEATIAELRAVGISPDLVEAIEVSQIADGILSIQFGRVDWGNPAVAFSALDGELDPWPENGRPAFWWPVARKGSTVIACLGAGDALFLASLLYVVGDDGDIYRWPNLPPVLKVAVPVALPYSGADSSPWILRPEHWADDLFTELMCPELQLAFLALPRQTAPAGFEEFVDSFLTFGESCEVVPALALLPPASSWRDLLSPFDGAAKAIALAGALECPRKMALAALNPKGDPP